MITSLGLLLSVVLTVTSAAIDPYPPAPRTSGFLQEDSADLWAGIGVGRNDAGAAAVSREQPSSVSFYVPACGGNFSAGRITGDAPCGRAVLLCAQTPSAGDLLYWRLIAPAGTGRTDNGWTFTGDELCRGAADVATRPVPVMTLEDFRRLPIPAGKVNIQPPNLRTLINVPTNVYVTAQVETLPTELLGIPVQVRATPQKYTWAFGDGDTLTTTDQGAEYPDLRTTHTYRKPARTAVTVTTAYAGEYSVDGGPWLPIDGQADVTSPATTLAVLAARSELVAETLP